MASRLAKMPRRVTGRIEPHEWADGRTVTFRLKVRTHGRRYTISLDTNHQGWSMERAQVELADNAADRARHLGAAHPEGICSESPRPRGDVARDRLPPVATSKDRAGQQYRARLQVAAR